MKATRPLYGYSFSFALLACWPSWPMLPDIGYWGCDQYPVLASAIQKELRQGSLMTEATPSPRPLQKQSPPGDRPLPPDIYIGTHLKNLRDSYPKRVPPKNMDFNSRGCNAFALRPYCVRSAFV
jgi:hypothetical protein